MSDYSVIGRIGDMGANIYAGGQCPHWYLDQIDVHSKLSSVVAMNECCEDVLDEVEVSFGLRIA